MKNESKEQSKSAAAKQVENAMAWSEWMICSFRVGVDGEVHVDGTTQNFPTAKFDKAVQALINLCRGLAKSADKVTEFTWWFVIAK